MSKEILAEKDGKLFIQLRAVMPPLVAMADGVEMIFFGREKTAYMRAENALSWTEQEAKTNPKYVEIHAAIVTIMEKFRKMKGNHEICSI